MTLSMRQWSELKTNSSAEVWVANVKIGHWKLLSLKSESKKSELKWMAPEGLRGYHQKDQYMGTPEEGEKETEIILRINVPNFPN